jgi:hypothetical protein
MADMNLFMNTTKKNTLSQQAAETYRLMHHWYGIPLPDSKTLGVDRIRVLLGLKTVYAIHGSQSQLVRMVLHECHRLFMYNRQNLLSYIKNRLIIRYHKKKMGLDPRSRFLTLLGRVFPHGKIQGKEPRDLSG